MNIDFYVSYKFEQNDSRSTSLKCLCTELSKKSHDVRVITPYTDFIKDSLPFEILPGLKKIRSFILGNIILNLKYRKHYKEKKPHIIIARPDSFLFKIHYYIKKNNVLLNIHTCIEEEAKINKLSFRHRFNMILAAKYREKIICKVKGVVFNHPLLEQYYYKKYDIVSTSIYNGINTYDFFPKEMTRQTNKDVYTCGFVGNISVWHGLEDVCVYFENYNKTSLKQIELIIIGKANHDFIEKISKYNFVKYLGEKDKSDANSILNNCDFCVVNVLSLRVSPGSPIKLFDYLAMNKPILTTTNVIGYSDIVTDYNVGSCVDFDDKNFEDFNSFLRDLNSYKINFPNAISEYSWESQSGKWLSFIKNSIKA